jgi:hypothetical protein
MTGDVPGLVPKQNFSRLQWHPGRTQTPSESVFEIVHPNLCESSIPASFLVWSNYSSALVLCDSSSRLPMLDQYKNKFTTARLPNAAMTPGFPNARQKPVKASDGAIYSVAPIANKATLTHASQKYGVFACSSNNAASSSDRWSSMLARLK